MGAGPDEPGLQYGSAVGALAALDADAARFERRGLGGL